MTAVKRKLDSDKTACENLPQEITSIASKIKYCSHAAKWNEEMTRALQEMIIVCQSRLDDLDSSRDEYAIKLQKRRNALAGKLMKRKR